MLKLICVEEHAVDPLVAEATGPTMQQEAPYIARSSRS